MTHTTSELVWLSRDKMPEPDALRQQDGRVWVFAYASLIWNPEIDHDLHVMAQVEGLVRDFSLKSVVFRGTQDCPGRVLGVRPPICETEFGCVGVAYRLHQGGEREAIAHLWSREMVSQAYQPVLVPMALYETESNADKNCAALSGISGLTFMVEPTDSCYAPHADAESVAHIVRNASGLRGPNSDYVLETADALKNLGIHDPYIEAVANLLKSV